MRNLVIGVTNGLLLSIPLWWAIGALLKLASRVFVAP